MSTSTSPLEPSAKIFADLPAIGQVALFPEREEDAEFLHRLYRSTREEELALTDWPEQVKQAFCDSQFDLQHTHYATHHPKGEFLIVRASTEPIGRLYVDGSGATVQLVDIALLPAWHSRGVGSALLAMLLTRAAEAGKAVTLQVLTGNGRAMALYQRFGFLRGTTSGSHIAMRWAG